MLLHRYDVARYIKIHCGVELPTILPRCKYMNFHVQVTYYLTLFFLISAYYPSALSEEFLLNKEAASF